MSGDNPEPAVEEDLEDIATFLPDLPLDGDTEGEAQFGHAGVAETLRTIVRQCPTPFTIALYGSWGTGKSSVVGLLGSLLKTKGIPTVVVDVWKYQDDSLRRTVLKELHRYGCEVYTDLYDQDTVLDERVEQQTSLATQFKLGIEFEDSKKDPKRWRLTKRLMWVLGIAAVVLVLGLLLFPLQVGPVFASVAAGVAAVLATLELTALLLTPKTRSWSQGRYADPYEFQDEFLRLLRDGYNGASKVLIVFDNLDRVDEEKAVEVLTTVKTFLETVKTGERSKAVFLVPCDDRAIREQVEQRFHNGDEFLRKFFNVSVRLPEFFGTELQDYTLGLLVETRIQALRDQRIAWMTAKAFRSNPRQVKQFVNVLVAEYLLANRRVITKELPEAFAEKNVLELALFQLLQTRFPKQVALFAERNQRSLEPPALAALTQDLGDDQTDDGRAAFKGFEESLRFLREVEHYARITDLWSWLTLRRSKHEAALPGVDVFLSNLEFAVAGPDVDDFIEGLGDDAATRHNLSLAVQEHAGWLTTAVSYTTFVDSLLGLLGERNRTLDAETLDELVAKSAGFVKEEPMLATLSIDPEHVIPELLDRQTARKVFTDAWVDIMAASAENEDVNPPRRFTIAVVGALSSKPDWFASRSVDVRSALVKVAGRDDELMGIIASGEDSSVWIDPLLAYAFADSLSAFDESYDFEATVLHTPSHVQLEAKVAILGRFPTSAIDGAVADRLLRSVVQVFDANLEDSPTNLADDWLGLIESARRVLALVAHHITEGQVEADSINEFTRVVKNVLNSSKDTAAHREAMLTVIDLGNTGGHPDKNVLVGFINDYLASGPVQEVRVVLEHMGGPRLSIWTQCEEALLERCTTDEAMFDAVIEDAPREDLPDWLGKMLPRVPERVLRSLPALELDGQTLTPLCTQALDLAAARPIEDQASILTAVAPVLRSEMDDALDAYAAGLSRLLISGDEVIASHGLHLLRAHPELLAETSRERQLALDILNWLKGNQDKHRPSPIEALVLLRGQLTPQEQNSLVELLFESHIQQDSRPEAVEHALNILAAMGVQYADRPPNFEDIRNRYHATEEETRAAIRRGLAMMKPPRAPRNPQAKAFWKWAMNPDQ